MTDGDSLYALVEEYSALGDHRTGSAVDRATIGWFADRLERLGARVHLHGYDFPQDITAATLRVGEDDVPVLPLSYAGTGTVEVVDPPVQRLEVFAGVLPMGVDEAVADAARRGAPALVLVTDAPAGRLLAVNRDPGPAAGVPTVLAPGRALQPLTDGPVHLAIDARIVQGRSANVIGWLGPSDAPTAVVTTPLTGWFRCAGERGTGIAVAMHVAERLARDMRICVVGSTGHELGHLGLTRWIDERAGSLGDPVAVVHLGASVAAGDPLDGRVTLSDKRLAMTSAPEAVNDQLRGALAPAGLSLTGGGDTWPGEGQEWRRLTAPVLSLTGGFERFHTPDDLPEAVTTPDLLDRVAGAVGAAASLLVQPKG